MPELLTVQEAADLLRIARITLYRLVHRKQIPYVRPGGKILFIRDDLMAWLRETTAVSPDNESDDTPGRIAAKIRHRSTTKRHGAIASELKAIADQARGRGRSS